MIIKSEFFRGIEPCDLDGNCEPSGFASGWGGKDDGGGDGWAEGRCNFTFEGQG